MSKKQSPATPKTATPTPEHRAPSGAHEMWVAAIERLLTLIRDHSGPHAPLSVSFVMPNSGTADSKLLLSIYRPPSSVHASTVLYAVTDDNIFRDLDCRTASPIREHAIALAETLYVARVRAATNEIRETLKARMHADLLDLVGGGAELYRAPHGHHFGADGWVIQYEKDHHPFVKYSLHYKFRPSRSNETQRKERVAAIRAKVEANGNYTVAAYRKGLLVTSVPIRVTDPNVHIADAARIIASAPLNAGVGLASESVYRAADVNAPAPATTTK